MKKNFSSLVDMMYFFSCNFTRRERLQVLNLRGSYLLKLWKTLRESPMIFAKGQRVFFFLSLQPTKMAMSGVGNWNTKVRLIFNINFVNFFSSCLFNRNHFTSPIQLSRKSSKSLHRWSSKASRYSIFGSQTSNYPWKNCLVSKYFVDHSSIIHENPSEGGHDLPESLFEDICSFVESHSEVGHNNIVVSTMGE